MFKANNLPTLDYDFCKKILGDKRQIKLCSETWLLKKDDYFSVTLFANEIMRVYKTHMLFSLCGWPTVTTKQRLKALTGHSVFTDKKVLHASIFPYGHKDFSFDNVTEIDKDKHYRIEKNKPLIEATVSKGE